MLVYLDERADLRSARNLSWQARGRFVHERLVETADRSQAPLRAWLDEVGIRYRAFWIDNVIVIEDAGQETLDALKTMPGIRAIKGESGSRLMTAGPPSDSPLRLSRRGEDEVSDAPGLDPRRGEEFFAPPPGARRALGGGREGVQDPTPATNIAHIGAPAVWAMGHTGQGITIGIIDSGARHTHEALVEQYRGRLPGGEFEHDYNWYDPVEQSAEPRFTHPHGTHVTGTAAGGGEEHAIGVAPGARWIACLGCSGQQCPDADLLACAQFMLAPTDTDGENEDADSRPHVVNNSWGDCSTTYNDWFQNVVDHWLAAGIVPVFSAGNAQACNYPRPPGLNTAGNPARYGSVLGVGSTGNSNGEYADHSNWGPTDNPNPGLPEFPDHFGFPEIKPNVVAPGVNIFSSVSSSDDAYQSGWNGTSMSAPHVAGLVALMWSAADCLERDYAATGTIIMRTARPIDFDSGGDPPPGPENLPNHATGWGEIDAVAAVAAAVEHCTPGFNLSSLPEQVSACTGEPAGFKILVRGRQDFDDEVSLEVAAGLPPGAEIEFIPNPVVPADPPAQSVLEITGDIAPGHYALTIGGESDGPGFEPDTGVVAVTLDVVEQVPGEAGGLTPGFGAGDQPLTPEFVWQPRADAVAYRFQLADHRDFLEPLIDETVADTVFTPPEALAPATLYYWRVAAVNACGEGAFGRPRPFVTEPLPGECPLGTDAVTLFAEDFGGGSLPEGWSTDGATGDAEWVVTDTRSYQSGYSVFADNIDTVSDQRLETPAILLPASVNRILLNFQNWQSIEAGATGCFDGGVVELSVDNGENWVQPGTGDVQARPYDGSVAEHFLNPLAGRQAWCGDPRDFWERYTIDLSVHGGQSVRLRFRFGTDNSVGRTGWHVDAVEVKACFDLFRDRFQ